MLNLKLCLVSCFIVIVLAKPSEDTDNGEEATCSRGCKGIGYECIEGKCYCADGYVPNYYYNRCLRCPKERERCFGLCCSDNENATLTCWQGFCRYCTDEDNNWICGDTFDSVFLISSTQIAMATALILGIIATFVLMYKLCAVTNLRPYGAARSNTDSRLSVGSLQLYIDERLRDAPPRYSRTAPSATPAIIPATVYLNAGFIHDSSLPPPPYTPPKEENQNASVHM